MIEIYVNDLEKAAKQAGKAAAQCTDYAKTLEKKVLHGINNYSGGSTANMSAAQRSINAKRSALTKKAQSFTDYQRKLTNFKDKVVNTENRLYGKITSLYGQFEKEYGIKSGENFWEKLAGLYWGKWGKEWFRQVKNSLQSCKERLRNWYKYNGGREMIQVVLNIAIAAAALAVAIASIGTGFIGLVSAVLAAITALNTVVQVAYYADAMAYAAKGITYMAGRSLMLGDKETFVTTLKRNGQYELARGVGTVEFICNVIKALDSAGQSIEKFKTAGGFKGIFKGFKTRMGSLKDAFSQGANSFKNASGIIKGGLSAIKPIVSGIYKYTDLKSEKGVYKLLSSGLKTVKALTETTWQKVTQDGLDNGISLIGKAIFGTVFKNAEGKMEQFSPFMDAVSTVKDSLKAVDGLMSTWNFKTVYNFSYDAKMGKDASKTSLGGGFKLENFGSVGKTVVYVTEKIADVTSSITSIMQHIKMPDMRTIAV